MRRAMTTSLREGWLSVVLLLAWWAASRNSESFYFPPLTEILMRFQELWLFDHAVSDVWPSLRSLTLAMLTSIVIAVPVGVVLGVWPRAYKVLEPMLTFVWAIPKIALFPAFIALMGITSGMQITYVVMGTLWPILLGTIDGVRAIDLTVSDTMYAYRVKKWTMFSRVLMPGAAPQIVAGVRTSLAIGLVLVIVGEMLATAQGLGYFVLQAQQSYAMADMWAGALLVGLIGYGINLLFSIFERYVLAWHIARRAAHAS